MVPVFEYDPNKSQSNREKHGLDFVEAQELWEVHHVVFVGRNVGGESRQIIVGELRGRMHVAIFTCRGTVVRLISCHKADSRWVREFEEANGEKKED